MTAEESKVTCKRCGHDRFAVRNLKESVEVMCSQCRHRQKVTEGDGHV